MRIFSVFLLFLAISCGNKSVTEKGITRENENRNTPLPGVDTLDVYQLKIGNTFLFTTLDAFISSYGLPEKILVRKDSFETRSKQEMLQKFKKAAPNEFTGLLYPGIRMEYFNDFIVADQIDFRKTNKTVNYKEISFDQTYTFDKFRQDFPQSANQTMKLPNSLFEIATNEKGNGLKHFMVSRRTSADPNEILFIEFTFQNDNLIFMSFGNIS